MVECPTCGPDCCRPKPESLEARIREQVEKYAEWNQWVIPINHTRHLLVPEKQWETFISDLVSALGP